MIKVALAPGQSNYYDSLSGVLLNLSSKEAAVADGCKTEGLLDGVRKGKIVVVSGNLTPETSNYNASKVIPTYYRLLKNRAYTQYVEARAIEKTILPVQEEAVAVVEEPVIEELNVEPITAEGQEIVPVAVEGQAIEPIVVEEQAEEEKPARQTRKRRKKAVEEAVEEIVEETGDVELEEVK